MYQVVGRSVDIMRLTAMQNLELLGAGYAAMESAMQQPEGLGVKPSGKTKMARFPGVSLAQTPGVLATVALTMGVMEA